MYFIIFYNIILQIDYIIINYKNIYNKISFVNIEINSLLNIMIYQLYINYSDLFLKKHYIHLLKIKTLF